MYIVHADRQIENIYVFIIDILEKVMVISNNRGLLINFFQASCKEIIV